MGGLVGDAFGRTKFYPPGDAPQEDRAKPGHENPSDPLSNRPCRDDNREPSICRGQRGPRFTARRFPPEALVGSILTRARYSCKPS